MTKVICEEAAAGRCTACPIESKPHELVRLEVDGKTLLCTETTKCWHIGANVKCIPVVDP